MSQNISTMHHHTGPDTTTALEMEVLEVEDLGVLEQLAVDFTQTENHTVQIICNVATKRIYLIS